MVCLRLGIASVVVLCQKDTGQAGAKSREDAGISPGLLRDNPRFKKLLARLK